MIVIILFFIYVIIVAIFIGILNAIDNLDYETTIIGGVFWPITIIISILIVVIEISEKITRKILEKWE